MIPKKTTKMIVKDGSGNLVQLLPEIETASTIDASSDVPVSNAALASALEDIEDSLPASALLDVMEEEPTALNTTELDDEALIVWVGDQANSTWSITINTELAGEGERTGQIPFHYSDYYYYDREDHIYTEFKVEWGDGSNTVSYPHLQWDYNNDTGYITHEYAEAGIYTITITCSNFEHICIDQSSFYGGPGTYRQTLISINSALPKIAGTFGWYWFDDAIGDCLNSFYGCFNGCNSLASIPENLFYNNPDFIDFIECFRNCSSLQSIPSGLFANNTAATSFIYCFLGCLNLNDFTLYIGSSLVEDCEYFVSKNDNATRTVYVPSGSTTQTTFDSVASNLGLTIIGE